MSLFYSLIPSAQNSFWHTVGTQEIRTERTNDSGVGCWDGFFISCAPLLSTFPFLGMTEFNQPEECKVR